MGYRIDTLKDMAYNIATEKSSTSTSGYKWDIDIRLRAMEVFAKLTEVNNGTRFN